MDRIAIISIIVEDNEKETIQQMNDLLHLYQDKVLGRMGLPDRAHNVNIICIALFADENIINTLTGKLGNITGITAKALYSKKTY